MMDRQHPHLSRIQRLRRWLAQAGGLLLVVAVLLIFGVLFWPRRYGQSVDGEVVKFIWYGRGASLSALVRVPAGDYLVPLRRPNNCKIGDSIQVTPVETLLGRRYAATNWMPCSADRRK